MKSKTQRRKIVVDPAKEIVSTMLRLARSGIDPGETVPLKILRWRYSDVAEGEFESHLHGKERKE